MFDLIARNESERTINIQIELTLAVMMGGVIPIRLFVHNDVHSKEPRSDGSGAQA